MYSGKIWPKQNAFAQFFNQLAWIPNTFSHRFKAPSTTVPTQFHSIFKLNAKEHIVT